MSHIRKVLNVSIVDLYAAEAYLVTDTPAALKVAIDTIIPKDQKIISGWSFISWNTFLVFSTTPPLHKCGVSQSTC